MKGLKEFELGRLTLYLTIISIVLYFLFYTLKDQIVSGLFPNEVLVTAQGRFNKDEVTIKMKVEGSLDTVLIYKRGKQIRTFKPIGLTRFFLYQNQLFLADFEYVKEVSSIGSTYHFYLSANADSVFMDMRVNGAGSSGY
ncbi:MAG: hypothetical protein AAF843_21005 [Bacteroidota bacterium]